MFKFIYLSLAIVFTGITLNASPAAALCSKTSPCKISSFKKTKTGQQTAYTSKSSRKYTKARKTKRVARLNRASEASRNRVVALIKQMAPRYGVPTWFALRIAKVESGYNPNARGSAGEIGVYQLKCATAKGIGYRGGCKGLYNASANVSFGLKHLSMAIRSSRGNLKLAASKHNGGLGRKRLVKHYVRLVF